MKLLRWIAILPVAILAYSISIIFTNLIHLLSVFFGINELNSWISELYSSGLAAALFVIIGTACAPKFTKSVAAILSSIMILLTLLTFSLDAFDNIQSLTIFNLIGTFIGAISGFVYIKEKIVKKL